MQINQEYCRYLRGKNAYGTLEGGEDPFLLSDTGMSTYWCISSMTSFGPDGGMVHISTCGNRKRTCFCEVKQEKEENEDK